LSAIVPSTILSYSIVADSSTATGLKWDTPAGGGITLITETVANAVTAIDYTSISGSYKNLILEWHGLYHSTTTTGFGLRFNANSASNYKNRKGFIQGTGAFGQTATETEAGSEALGYNSNLTDLQKTNAGVLTIYNYASSSKLKHYTISYAYINTSSVVTYFNVEGTYDSTSPITEINIFRITGSATLSNATNTSIRLYGVS
jgi:hypothetical protein